MKHILLKVASIWITDDFFCDSGRYCHATQIEHLTKFGLKSSILFSSFQGKSFAESEIESNAFAQESNTLKDSGLSSKMTPSYKWPICPEMPVFGK